MPRNSARSNASTTALVGMGGNLGNVSRTFGEAEHLLSSLPVVGNLRSSRRYRTTPIGTAAGETFLNAALALDVSCRPDELLQELQRIESALGRTREIHWGPRSLDLDIIGFGDEIINSPELTIPHPACWYRRFVLDPLLEVAPGWRHPVLGESVVELRERLVPRPLSVSVVVDTDTVESAATDLRYELERTFPASEVTVSATARSDGTPSALMLDNESVALHLSLSVNTGPRVISLVGRNSPVDFAIQVIRAALDAPAVDRS